MPVTQSAHLPVGPFGAEPAAPALAGKAPPDALAAAPVIARAALSSVLLLWVAGPAAAIAPVPVHHHSCPAKHAQQQSAAAIPAKPVARPATALGNGNGGSSGGSGFGHWLRITSDVMP
jgi:hypothetical protein